jgi:uncharacterized repeat protein (TIGR01451 family)
MLYANTSFRLRQLAAAALVLALFMTAIPAPVQATGSASTGGGTEVGAPATEGGDGADGASATAGDDAGGTQPGTDGTDANGAADGADGETLVDDGAESTTEEETTTEEESGTDNDTDIVTESDEPAEPELEATETEEAATDETTSNGEEVEEPAEPAEDTIESEEETGPEEVGDNTAPAGSNGNSGSTGEGGADNGSPEETTEEPTESVAPDPVTVPVPVFTSNELGVGEANDEAEVTGEIEQSGNNVTIESGPATAQGGIDNAVNSSVVMSETDGDIPDDLDFYTFNATGTNEAEVDNDALVFAHTGENVAEASSIATITTGDAYAALNIANVVNTNVVNSEGYLYLKNLMVAPNQALNLEDLFFPNSTSLLAGAADCTLLSCMAEDIEYNFSQTNDATVVNNAFVEAVTGQNEAEGDFTSIATGDAYAGANVVNVVNTNIIDSNYRFITLNAMGDLDGDLVLPTQELFDAFFGRPNGLSQTEDAEGVRVRVTQTNDAVVKNDIDSNAETGTNNQAVAYDSSIVTGNAASESNVLNKANQNVYGGDSMYLLIRVHGDWYGDVHGLPDGLTWEWTPDGILIYNEGAEITPSEILPYDVDSYTANIADTNDTLVENNITVDAITGENAMAALVGEIRTGDAVASANVMNIANTNIVGANFSFAVINIFGDFAGDVTFSSTDLELTGFVSSLDNPVGPGSLLTYEYTIANNGDITATNVTLRQTLQLAHANTTTNNQQFATIDSLAPGASETVSLTATVHGDVPYGTHTATATAVVDSDEADAYQPDNVVVLRQTITHPEPADTSGTSSDPGDNDTASSSDDGSGDGTVGDTASSSDNGTGGETENDDQTGASDDTNSSNTTTNPPRRSSGGGGGGGGGSTKTDAINRSQTPVNGSDSSFLWISKEADVDVGDTITAGETVEYTITVNNSGGTAYDVTVFDTLKNPIGAVVNEQSWDLGTVLPGEEIEIEYETAYSPETPSGPYTNIASVEAYREAGDKAAGADPLSLPDAEHEIFIDGVALAVGNVGPLLYYPSRNGSVGVLMAWETSSSSESQLFYSPITARSVYNPLAPRLGYQFAANRNETAQTHHYRIITGLQRGMTYTLRIQAENAEAEVASRQYTITIPAVVARPMLPQMAFNQPQVAGVATTEPTTPAPTPTPTPRPVQPYVAPAPPTPAPPAPAPEPEPEPEPQPEPAPAAASNSNAGNGVGGFVKKVFGFFR